METKPRFYQRDSFKLFLITSLVLLIFCMLYFEGFRNVVGFFKHFLLTISGKPEPTLIITSQAIFSIVVLILNILGFGLFFIFFIYQIAIYVLPISKLSEQRPIYLRLMNYISFHPGPAIFVKDGKKASRTPDTKPPQYEFLKSEVPKPKKEPNGPGVVLVDMNSAIILEKTSRQPGIHRNQKSAHQEHSQAPNDHFRKPKVRVEGPGIVFTEENERIHNTADTRSQIRLLKDVIARTRNGIELQTNLTIIFSIGMPPEILQITYQDEFTPENLRVIYTEFTYESDEIDKPHVSVVIKSLEDELDQDDKEFIYRTVRNHKNIEILSIRHTKPDTKPWRIPFILNDQRIFSALYSRAKDVQKNRYADWTDLPPRVALEFFRKLLADIHYDDLYRVPSPAATPLRDFKTRFARQIRNQGVLAFQFVHRRDGFPMQPNTTWDEHELFFYPVKELRPPKVLRARGIKVIHTGFSELIPVSDQVRKSFLENWCARKQRDADILIGDSEFEIAKKRVEARSQAQQIMIENLTKIIQATPLSEEALVIQLFQTLESAADEPATRRLLPADTINLLSMINRLLVEEGEV